MNHIVIDAANWKTVLDFLAELKTAIGAPGWHGDSPDAFVDSIIYGGINEIEPPYVVEVIGLDPSNRDVCEYVTLLSSVIATARALRADEGVDVPVEILAAPLISN